MVFVGRIRLAVKTLPTSSLDRPRAGAGMLGLCAGFTGKGMRVGGAGTGFCTGFSKGTGFGTGTRLCAGTAGLSLAVVPLAAFTVGSFTVFGFAPWFVVGIEGNLINISK